MTRLMIIVDARVAFGFLLHIWWHP